MKVRNNNIKEAEVVKTKTVTGKTPVCDLSVSLLTYVYYLCI